MTGYGSNVTRRGEKKNVAKCSLLLLLSSLEKQHFSPSVKLFHLRRDCGSFFPVKLQLLLCYPR